MVEDETLRMQSLFSRIDNCISWFGIYKFLSTVKERVLVVYVRKGALAIYANSKYAFILLESVQITEYHLKNRL